MATRSAWLLLVVVATAAAFLLRCLALAVLRAERPRAAVERWWAWTPVAVVLVAITWVNPWLGLPLAAGTWWALTRAGAIGSPFRPRR